MLNDLPLMSFLREKMKWHQARQAVLASNVANADTPGYKPSDLKEISFERHMLKARTTGGKRQMAGLSVTNSKHMQISSNSSADFKSMRGQDFEVTPGGNGVVLEDQMTKIAGNQFDYQMATTVYSRSMGLLKIAIGRG